MVPRMEDTFSPSLDARRAMLSQRASILIRVCTWLWRCVDRRRQRRRLAALDPYLLTDIGLTREAAQREAEKPSWRQ
jgi:uncharacterized protein YjiS (DUF1127 family)